MVHRVVWKTCHESAVGLALVLLHRIAEVGSDIMLFSEHLVEHGCKVYGIVERL